jgi:hypothetical protein
MVFIMNLAQPVMIKSLAGLAVLMEFPHFTHMPLHLFMYFMRTVISERWGFSTVHMRPLVNSEFLSIHKA